MLSVCYVFDRYGLGMYEFGSKLSLPLVYTFFNLLFISSKQQPNLFGDYSDSFLKYVISNWVGNHHDLSDQAIFDPEFFQSFN